MTRLKPPKRMTESGKTLSSLKIQKMMIKIKKYQNQKPGLQIN